jgi:dethiobiotin synthetase
VFAFPLVVVARQRWGRSTTLLTLEAARAGLRVAGIVLNQADRAPATIA